MPEENEHTTTYHGVRLKGSQVRGLVHSSIPWQDISHGERLKLLPFTGSAYSNCPPIPVLIMRTFVAFL